MSKKDFEYTLEFKNNKIVMSDNYQSKEIFNQEIQKLVKSINNNNVQSFVNYNDTDLAVTFNNGALVLEEYKKFFDLDEFASIKSRYLDYIRKQKLNIIKNKGKYIAITSSLIVSLLCGIKLNNLNNTQDINNELTIEKVNPEDVPKQVEVSKNVDKAEIKTSNYEVDDLVNSKSDKEVNSLVNVSYGDNVDSEKFKKAENEYDNIIKKYARKYGLDYNLILAMCTQERGIHSNKIDNGGGLGLMQIQVSAHPDGSTINTTTFDSAGNPQDATFTFYQDNYQNLNGNIEAGCALLRSYLNSFNGNIIAALYAYNSGNGAVRSAITKYAKDYGMSYDDVLKDYNNYSWNRYIISDNNNYLDAVMQYFIDDTIHYYNVKYDNNN